MFQLFKAVLFSRDFWSICIPYLCFTLLANFVIDNFLIKKILETEKGVFNAMQVINVVIFTAITVLLTFSVRERVRRLIQEGSLEAWPRSIYRQFPVNIVWFSLREPQPIKREFHFFFNVTLMIGVAFYVLNMILVKTGIYAKHFVFSTTTTSTKPCCCSCAIIIELTWKGVLFLKIFALQYAAGMNRGQVELRSQPLK